MNLEVNGQEEGEKKKELKITGRKETLNAKFKFEPFRIEKPLTWSKL